MSKIIDFSPNPKSHIKTLMRIGYTMSSAVADILDNSITAHSKNIQIYAPPGFDEPLISIMDDGYGMGFDELVASMRIGCKDPASEREKGDLGRFGSGMKTASFSQARRLTVISKKIGNPVVAAIWDIDRIEETNTWCLEILDENEINSITELKIDANTEQGTQIIWERLSCFQKNSHAPDKDTELALHLSELRQYIALYFHKFMEGQNKCNFYLNKEIINPIDPFITKSEGYQEGRSEKIRCKGGYIFIKTHVLPHMKRIKGKDLDDLGGAQSIVQNQGIYIYRENRLIIAGGWQGLVKNSQLGALARVEVNVPSTLDHEWSTDVKKSSLQLPPRIKKELRKYLSDPIKRSKRVYTHRGTVEEANKFWKVCEDENKEIITYQIDPGNENLSSLLRTVDKESRTSIIQYLNSLSKNLPINNIYQKMSENPKHINQDAIDISSLESILHKIL